MPPLRPIELKLIDDLTNMSSGYVLDFSNKTFAEFFQAEVGVDIYDDAYADGSGSKGKRLRAFLVRGQALAIVRALEAIWEYREVARINRGEAETVTDAHGRLSAIVERLGGRRLPNYNKATPAPACNSVQLRPSESVLEQFRIGFMGLHQMKAHERGYAFERFLESFFTLWGLKAKGGFRTQAEQIDGSFAHDGETYLIEAKWHANPTNGATLHAFQGKLNERVTWARGLFVSYNGFTREALAGFTSKSIILMDGSDLMDCLQRRLDLGEAIRAKSRYAVERKVVFQPTRDLL